MNVLLHVPDKSRTDNAFSNAKNILKEGGQLPRIQIVFNANAVIDVLEKVIPDELTDSKHVELILCHNSLKTNNIDPGIIPARFTIVPAAILYLMQEQHNGAIYIRP